MSQTISLEYAYINMFFVVVAVVAYIHFQSQC